jgi:hypothetical protein
MAAWFIIDFGENGTYEIEFISSLHQTPNVRQRPSTISLYYARSLNIMSL